MDNEKLTILKMLEEKRITAEEAARLLKAIDEKTFTSTSNQQNKKTTTETNWASSGNRNTTDRNTTDRNTTNDNTTNRNTTNRNTTNRNTTDRNTNKQYTNKQRPNNDQGNFDDLASNLSKKLDILIKDLEPKLSKFSEQVVKTTSGVADKISKSLQGTPTRSRTYSSGTPRKPNTSNTSGLEQTNIELLVSGNDNQLKLSSINGDINLKGYNGDKITAKIFYRRKNPHGSVNLVQFGNKYMMDFNEEDFDKISIDAFVPESLFENIILDSVGGIIDIATLKTGNFVLENMNGQTVLNEIHADNIKINCNNNSLIIKNVTGNIGKIENFNGNTSLANLDIANLKLDAFNSGIDISILNFNNYAEYMWEITSNNGKISLNLPTANNIGYYINARTNLSTVKSTLIGLNYLANSESFIEAKSINYDSATKKIMIRAETSNAQIAIN